MALTTQLRSKGIALFINFLVVFAQVSPVKRKKGVKRINSSFLDVHNYKMTNTWLTV